MAIFREKEKNNFTTHMETQKTMNSHINSEKNKVRGITHPDFKYITKLQ